MFKFIKELIDAAKEGVEEAKTERAQELAHESQLAEKKRFEQNNALAAIPMKEKFAVALGAPYRCIFVGDQLYELCGWEIDEKKKSNLAKYLERDFGIDSRLSLLDTVTRTRVMASFLAAPKLNPESVLEEIENKLSQSNEGEIDFESISALPIIERLRCLLQQPDGINSLAWHGLEQSIVPHLSPTLPDESRSRIALWLGRQSYMVSASVGLGYLYKEEAMHLLQPIIALGVKYIHDWEEYAALFIAGDKQDKSNNALGRKLLAGKVQSILENTEGVWQRTNWGAL